VRECKSTCIFTCFEVRDDNDALRYASATLPEDDRWGAKLASPHVLHALRKEEALAFALQGTGRVVLTLAA